MHSKTQVNEEDGKQAGKNKSNIQTVIQLRHYHGPKPHITVTLCLLIPLSRIISANTVWFHVIH